MASDNEMYYTDTRKHMGKFSLFHPSGVQVYFTAPADGADVVLQRVDEQLEVAFAHGYTIRPAGIDEGEKLERVTGWVLGETSKDEPCVYLYGAPQLKYRIATVWVEDIAGLPFAVDTDSRRRWLGAAPEREMAIAKGVFHAHDFEIVMEQQGTTDAGKPKWKYARVHGAKPAPVKPPVTVTGSNGVSDATWSKWLALAKKAESLGAVPPPLKRDDPEIVGLLKESVPVVKQAIALAEAKLEQANG